MGMRNPAVRQVCLKDVASFVWARHFGPVVRGWQARRENRRDSRVRFRRELPERACCGVSGRSALAEWDGRESVRVRRLRGVALPCLASACFTRYLAMQVPIARRSLLRSE